MYMLKVDPLRSTRTVSCSSSWDMKWHVEVEWLVIDPDPLKDSSSKYFFWWHCLTSSAFSGNVDLNRPVPFLAPSSHLFAAPLSCTSTAVHGTLSGNWAGEMIQVNINYLWFWVFFFFLLFLMWLYLTYIISPGDRCARRQEDCLSRYCSERSTWGIHLNCGSPSKNQFEQLQLFHTVQSYRNKIDFILWIEVYEYLWVWACYLKLESIWLL